MESNDPKAPQVEGKELPANALVTKEELDEFKKLAKKEYSVELTDEQAFEQATALLLLFDSVIETTLVSRKKRVNIDTGL